MNEKQTTDPDAEERPDEDRLPEAKNLKLAFVRYRHLRPTEAPEQVN